jgi:hypothetical protein
MSYRKVVRWARQHLGMVISTVGVGRVVEGARQQAEQRRQERFSARQFEALVVDAVWVRYRRSPLAGSRNGLIGNAQQFSTPNVDRAKNPFTEPRIRCTVCKKETEAVAEKLPTRSK